MTNDHSRAAWQLPSGVSRGTWDYVQEPSIASDYDQFHAGHPLLELDQKLVSQHLTIKPSRPDGSEPIAIDFGCGTGRHLLALAQSGWRVIGADLSQSMLREYSHKAQQCGVAEKAVGVQLNMVRLECLADGFADAVLCMYSSLGMVQGRKNRVSFLKGVRRILRSSGVFFVHVHNRTALIRDPGGMRRWVTDRIRSRWDKHWEVGDSVYAYRGLPSMFLHTYSERELRRDLRESGLQIQHLYRLNRQSSDLLQGKWLKAFRSGGYLAVCQTSS